MASRKRVDKLTINNHVCTIQAIIKITLKKNASLSSSQVVSMRKDVKRARLWLINQLSQRAKRLTSKKVQNDQQKAKNVRKTERFLEEIKVLKHIDVDDVSKYALCHMLDPTQTNLDALEVEQRAMFRLATHKFIQNQVSKFRENHPIAIDKLVLLIRSLGLKYQKKKNETSEKEGETEKKLKADKQKRIHKDVEDNCEEQLPKAKRKKSESKVSDSKKDSLENEPENNAQSEPSEGTCISENELSEEDNSSENELSQERSDENDLPEEDKILSEENHLQRSKSEEAEFVEEPEISEIATKDPSQTKVTKNPKDNKLLKKDSESDKKVVKTKKDLIPRKKIAWPEAKNLSIDKKEGTMVIKQLNLEKLQDSAELVFEEPEDSFFIHKKGSELPRSSFFVGGIDEVEVEPVKDISKENAHSSQRWNLKETYDNLKPKNDRFNKKSNTSNKYNSNKHKDIKTAKPGKFSIAEFNLKETKENFLIILDNNESVDTNLHPAWVAKRNLQKAQKIEIGLNSGQGKKITFDD